jgi:hypothetical protein
MKNGRQMEIRTYILEVIGKHRPNLAITEPVDIGKQTNMDRDGYPVLGRAETIEGSNPSTLSTLRSLSTKKPF